MADLVNGTLHTARCQGLCCEPQHHTEDPCRCVCPDWRLHALQSGCIQLMACMRHLAHNGLPSTVATQACMHRLLLWLSLHEVWPSMESNAYRETWDEGQSTRPAQPTADLTGATMCAGCSGRERSGASTPAAWTISGSPSTKHRLWPASTTWWRTLSGALNLPG